MRHAVMGIVKACDHLFICASIACSCAAACATEKNPKESCFHEGHEGSALVLILPLCFSAISPGLKLYGGAQLPSPVLHLHLAKSSGDTVEDSATLRRLTDHMLVNSGVLFGVSRYSMLDIHKPVPSLVMYANVGLGEKEIHMVLGALRKAVKDIIRA